MCFSSSNPPETTQMPSMEGQVFDSNGVGKTVYWIVCHEWCVGPGARCCSACERKATFWTVTTDASIWRMPFAAAEASAMWFSSRLLYRVPPSTSIRKLLPLGLKEHQVGLPVWESGELHLSFSPGHPIWGSLPHHCLTVAQPASQG